MKIERFKSIAIEIEEIVRTEEDVRYRQTRTSMGSKNWQRMEERLRLCREAKRAHWKEIEQALYG